MNHYLLSRGAQGIIIYPALNASYENMHKYVSKIASEQDMKNEKRIYDALPENFDNIIYDKECRHFKFDLAKSPLQKCTFLNNIKPHFNSFITIKYFDGVVLSDMLKNDFYINNKQIFNFFKKYNFLCKIVHNINMNNGIFHRDITLNNIMYNPYNNEIRLIDFSRGDIRTVNLNNAHFYDKDLKDLTNVLNNLVDGFKKRGVLKNIPKFNNIQELNGMIPIIKELLKNAPPPFYKKK